MAASSMACSACASTASGSRASVDPVRRDGVVGSRGRWSRSAPCGTATSGRTQSSSAGSSSRARPSAARSAALRIAQVGAECDRRRVSSRLRPAPWHHVRVNRSAGRGRGFAVGTGGSSRSTTTTLGAGAAGSVQARHPPPARRRPPAPAPADPPAARHRARTRRGAGRSCASAAAASAGVWRSSAVSERTVFPPGRPVSGIDLAGVGPQPQEVEAGAEARLLDEGQRHTAAAATLEARLHHPDLAHVASQLAAPGDVADACVEHCVHRLLQRRERADSPPLRLGSASSRSSTSCQSMQASMKLGATGLPSPTRRSVSAQRQLHELLAAVVPMRLVEGGVQYREHAAVQALLASAPRCSASAWPVCSSLIISSNSARGRARCPADAAIST